METLVGITFVSPVAKGHLYLQELSVGQQRSTTLSAW
jgi:hypothetical protein